MNRRLALALALASAGLSLLAATHPAAAKGPFPTKPINLIVPFPPGGGVDVQARLIMEPLSKALGQPIVVQYKTGAGGNIGTQALLAAPPDGYTLMVSAPGPLSTNHYLYPDVKYNPVKDFTPIAFLSKTPAVLVVNPKVMPVNNLSEFLAQAKKSSPPLSIATQGTGGIMHLSSMLLEEMAGVEFNYVNYRGGAPAIQDLLGGVFPAMFNELPSILPHIQSGALRALAVSTTETSRSLPSVPSVSATLPGFETSVWFGVVGPKDMPQDVTRALQDAFNSVLNIPGVKEGFDSKGAIVVGGSPEKQMAQEAAKWGKIIEKKLATTSKP